MRIIIQLIECFQLVYLYYITNAAQFVEKNILIKLISSNRLRDMQKASRNFLGYLRYAKLLDIFQLLYYLNSSR